MAGALRRGPRLLWLTERIRGGAPLAIVVLLQISHFPYWGIRGKTRRMKIEALHIGMRVRHPQYGVGVVKTISEATAEIQFDEGRRTVAPEPSGLVPAEAQASIRELEVPLAQVIQQAVEATIQRLGLEKPESVVELLGVRWHKGRAVLHPADPTLQTKEVPLDIFFHKVVMIRNNLRVLEQKINAHAQLTDGEKVDMQQYITRCYGSLTTFNLLFKEKEDQF